MNVLSTRRQIPFLFIISVFILSGAGCDFISSLKEYFVKPKESSIQDIKSQSKTPALSLPTADQPLAADVLARVGKWTLTKQEFQDRLAAIKEVVPDYDIGTLQNRQLVLEEIVRQQLLVEDAERSGMANQKDIQDAVEEFRRSIIVQETVRQLTEKIEVTEDEVTKFYNDNKALMKEIEEWHVSEIVLEDQAKASEFLVEVLKGADFAELARQNSVGDTKDAGGDLGFINESNAPFPQMFSAITPLDVGGVSSVFKGPKDRYYIVKVQEKRGGREVPLEELKNDIMTTLKQQKQQQVLLDRLKELEQGIGVKINETLLQ